MDEFLKALAQSEAPTVVNLAYRLYYDIETGIPLFVTSENPAGNWIPISENEYNNLRLTQVKVVNKTVKKLDMIPKSMLQLTLSSTGEFKTITNDMMILTMSDNCDRYSIKKHE